MSSALNLDSTVASLNDSSSSSLGITPFRFPHCFSRIRERVAQSAEVASSYCSCVASMPYFLEIIDAIAVFNNEVADNLVASLQYADALGVFDNGIA